MSNILIIGAGGVSQVATVKCAMNADVFTKITLASRTKSKCDAIAKFNGFACAQYLLNAAKGVKC